MPTSPPPLPGREEPSHPDPRPLALSIVIPIFNEEAVLPELHRRVDATARAMGQPYEIIFVDDGSTDGSREWLTRLVAVEPAVRLIELSRNFGQTMAVSAGLDYAAGALVCLMDGDLQDPPEDLPRLVEKLREGYDAVYAVRVKRKESIARRLGTGLFYRVLARIASTPLPVDSGLFCVMTRPVVEALKQLPERSRYVTGLRAWVGFRQCGLPLERDARRGGQAKSWWKLGHMALDGMISFSHVPLRLATLAGLATALLSLAGIVCVVCLRLFTPYPPSGWASTVFVILFVGSIQLLALGVIGEYLGRVLDEVKGRPLYVVRRCHGFSPDVRTDGDAGSHASRADRRSVAV